jgi:alpha-glucosidase
MWWQDAVIYQIYPRSFQDFDGDGVGDLPGIRARLGHLTALGVDALWLSPVYPSPLADFGYDVSDYRAIDPVYGTLEDFDALVADAHRLGLRVLMDLVPCHTSIEHPWFREHPDWYIQVEGERPPNNWRATFGGPAWSRDERSGRWYLHSFYPEQPDLDWRNPEVARAISEVIGFWTQRGVDGFRVDAIDRLLKDAALRDDPPAQRPFELPLGEEYGALEHKHSSNAPDIEDALAVLRRAAGDRVLVGEVYLPTPAMAPYLRHLDLAFAFEFLFAPLQAKTLAGVIEPALALERVAWVMSNHDFGRATSRFGPGRERIAALLLLSLPGTAFLYYGEEIGLTDGPGHNPPYDRAGRDPARHPMQWDASAGAGFSTGAPWLEPVDPQTRNVAAQESDRQSLLWFYRDAIALRRRLTGPTRLLPSAPGVLAFARGEHVVALNLCDAGRPAPPAGELELASDGSHTGQATAELAPLEGFVAVRR